MSKIPEWAARKAELIAADAVELHTNKEIASLANTIALALVEAERLGVEKAAAVADHRVALAADVSPEAAGALFVALPDAIRQLAEDGK